MAKAGTQSVLGKLAQFGQLSINQKVAVLAGLLFLAVVLAGAWMYATAPTWRVLYTNLSDRDGGDIIAALSQMNIPYKTEDGGAIMVPAGQVYEIRLKLASKGLPKGSTVGFELMDNEKLGTSQFIEQVDYQRALEGELTRSIESLSQIQGARVHLAIPAQSVFVRDQQQPTASVLVSLAPGQALAPAQVEGIARLVAAGVPGLTEDHVTVVDQNGNVLSRAARDNDGLDATQLDYRAQVEKQLARHIEDILAPLAGPANVRAQVTADIDFSQSSQVSEQYQPNGTPATAAIRSQQTQETTDGGTPAASGVPGAASNQPPGAKPAPAAPAPAGPSSKNSVTNYEVDKTVRQVKDVPGAIRRLSVAVVINDKKLVNRDGTAQSVPYSAAEMAQINTLVKEAMGFDAQRGDSVNVVNAAFDQPAPQPVAKTPFYRNPDTIALAETLGRDLAAAAVVVFVLLTVRRMILQMKPATPPAPPVEVPAAAQEGFAPAAPRPGVMAYEQAVSRAQEVARNDPAVVANVVKDWLGNE